MLPNEIVPQFVLQLKTGLKRRGKGQGKAQKKVVFVWANKDFGSKLYRNEHHDIVQIEEK